MNQNTFGKTQAANDLVRILEDKATEKTIKTIGKKLTEFNRGLNAILTIKDEKIKTKLLKIWKETNLDITNDLNISKNIISHLRNVELAYFKRKTCDNTTVQNI